MPGFVDSTVKDIESRLQELQSEVAKLEAARAALVGQASSAVARPRRGGSQPRASRPAAARRPGRPRGRRGGNTRSNQALELVRKQPGITIPEIAEALKIEPNYLYRVMPKLVGEGLVTREGQGWMPAKNGASAS